MRLQRNKTLTAVALTIILTSATLITSVFLVRAQASTVTTYAYVAANPNPVGVNQQVVVNTWVEPLQPSAFDFFHEMKVTITHPDGTTETKGPFTSTVVGSYTFVYTPTTTGTYTFQLTYPGETFADANIAYSASTSPPTDLTVQQEPIQAPPEVPVPNDYWTRPINSQNVLWASISGDWLGS